MLTALGKTTTFLEQVRQWIISKPAHLGLDIDNVAIVLLELREKAGHFILENLAIETLPKNTLKEDRIEAPSVITQLLHKTKTQFNAMTKQVILATPANLVATAYTRVSKYSNDEQRIRHAATEIRNAFPEMYRDLYYDFTIVDAEPNAAQQDENSLPLLLVAARKEEMKPRIDAVEASGLVVKILEIDYYAVERAFALISESLFQEKIEGDVAILNIGTAAILLVVLHEGKLAYFQRQGYDIVYLRKSTRAGLKACKEGTSMDFQPDSLEAAQEQLVMQVQQMLEGMSPNEENLKLDVAHIVLSGPCAILPNFSTVFEENLGIPTVVANPFVNLSLASHLNPTFVQQCAPACLLACGLALHGLSR